MAKKLEVKEFPFILTKMDEAEGTFEGYASIFDVVDSYGDSVARGAFKKTLRDNPAFHMLWSHLITEPIGIIRGKEDKVGLTVSGKLNTDIQRGKEVRSHMKQAHEAGIPMGLSIGYQTLKEDADREAGTRILKEIKLWEVSVCLFQACPGAIISDIKAEIVNVAGESVELCDDCLALLNKEPEQSTLEVKPPDDKGEPDFSIHLLDGLILKVKE